MATASTRWAFTLPDPADSVDITKLNADFVTIDNALGITPCTTGTRPSTPVNGQAIYETDSHDAYVFDTSGVAGVWYHLVPPIVQVANDVTATANVNPTQVGDLTITVAGSTSYALDAFIVYSSATAADAVLSFSLPSGATVLLTSDALTSTATTTSSAVERAAVTTTSLTLGGAGVGVLVAAHVKGLIRTSTASGNVVANWAQSVSDPSNTVLKSASWMRLQRI